MQYAVLGKTGLKISRIGFGGIPIQQLDQEAANRLIGETVAKGINFIDTSRIYNGSEELLGNALKGLRDKVYLATKSMARDVEGLEKDLRKSLASLQTDHIELYQFHNIGNIADFNKVMAPGGGLELLLKYKEQGVIGHIGITSHSLPIIEKALEYEVFETIQYPYNAVEQQAEEVFKRAKARNVGVIAMKPFAGGAITSAREALKFILENENVTCAIPGMDKLEQLDQNIAAADGVPLSREDREVLLKGAKELGETFCRRCGYCQPCPSGINIPMVFIVEGYYTRYGLTDWAMERYASLPAKADACTKCGACEPKCPYKLPIRAMLEKAGKILKR